MEYSIQALSALAGISTRTLRYYDEIGLLPPCHTNAAGYRFYGEKELTLLQQILFYRERGLALEQIRAMIYDPDFDTLQALYSHLQQLEIQQARLTALIATVKKTIAAEKGDEDMQNEERFAVFRAEVVAGNEQQYGQEVRKKYGDAQMDAANAKLMCMTEADYERFQSLGEEISLRLAEVVQAGISPESEEGRRIVVLHKEWLSMTWSEYSRQAHIGLAEMYVMDERFTAYYDRRVAGCADFLRNAVRYWLEEKGLTRVKD